MAQSNTLRLYAYSIGRGNLGDPIVENAQTLPVDLPFLLTEEYVFAASEDPGVLWLTEELAVDEINVTGTAVLPFPLPAVLQSEENEEAINAYIRTRRYTFGTMERKRFSKAQFDIVMYDSSDANLQITTVNPDTDSTLMTITNTDQEDYVRRVRVAKQGYGAELIVNTTSGRASIRGCSLEAVVPGATTKSED